MTKISSEAERSQIGYARLAGFMFLFVDAADGLGLSITSRFTVPGDFAETARRIMGAEFVYRVGLSSLLVGSLCTVFLAMGLYVAVKPINRNLALLALLFRLVEATIFGVQNLFSFVVLKAYVGADLKSVFDAKQLSAFVGLRSGGMSAAGFNVASIFFSVGSVLFFYLFLKSNYIPKFLAALGLYGSALVTMTCFAFLIWPHPAKMLALGWVPCGIGEVLVGLWLLFKGVNVGCEIKESSNATVLITA